MIIFAGFVCSKLAAVVSLFVQSFITIIAAKLIFLFLRHLNSVIVIYVETSFTRMRVGGPAYIYEKLSSDMTCMSRAATVNQIQNSTGSWQYNTYIYNNRRHHRLTDFLLHIACYAYHAAIDVVIKQTIHQLT